MNAAEVRRTIETAGSVEDEALREATPSVPSKLCRSFSLQASASLGDNSNTVPSS